MFDLLHVAIQADITRVFTFMMARELSNLTYPHIGVPEPHHSISHHQDSEETMVSKGVVDRYHTELFARFVARLAATPDGEGSLLDNSLLMFGSGDERRQPPHQAANTHRDHKRVRRGQPATSRSPTRPCPSATCTSRSPGRWTLS